MSVSSQELRPRGRRSAAQPLSETAPFAAAEAVTAPVAQVPKTPFQTTASASGLRPRDAARRARLGAITPEAGSRPAPVIPPAPATAPASKSNRSLATPSVAAQELNRAAARRVRRRAAVPASRPGLRSAKTAQRGGIALAAAGLALAFVAPSTVGTAPATVPVADGVPLSSAPISAAADAVLDFSETKTTSKADPDSKLRQLLSASASKVAPAAAKGTLSAPLASMTVVSPFGYRVSPLTGASGELHTGQDLVAACSTQAYAAAGGTVTFASWDPFGGGNRVVIDHGNGLSTTYNHNSSLQVKVGQKVSRGDVVSLTGTTGNSTGCHLHFEVMVNDKTVDPQGWL